jgi:hypothetical protein
MIRRGRTSRPMKNAGLNRKWNMEHGKTRTNQGSFPYSIYHVPCRMRFFSILLADGKQPGHDLGDVRAAGG